LSGDPASIRPRLIRAALSLAPATWNPAWRYGDVIRAELGPAARIAIDPRQVVGKIGMRTMNQSMFELYKAGKITFEIATQYSHNLEDMKKTFQVA